MELEEAAQAETPAAAEEAPADESVPGEGQDGQALLDSIFSDSPPDSVAALEAIIEKEGKDFSVSAAQFAALPLEAKQLITNMRRMTTQKTQGLADERRVFTGREKVLADRERKFEQERAKMHGLFANDAIKDAVKPPEGEAPDIFTEEGQKWRIQQGVAAHLGEFMKAIGTVSEEAKAVVEQQMAGVRQEEQRTELRTWIDTVPDWDEYSDEVADIVEKQGLHYKDALLLAKARRPPEQAAPDPIEESRRGSRGFSRRGAGGAKPQLTLAQLQSRSSR